MIREECQEVSRSQAVCAVCNWRSSGCYQVEYLAVRVLSHSSLCVSTELSRTMAPLGMVDMLSGASSPEVGIISLVVFLVLSITMVGLCARCHR